MGFVRKVVLFWFCLLNVQRVGYSLEYQLIEYLYIDVAGVYLYKKYKCLGVQ